MSKKYTYQEWIIRNVIIAILYFLKTIRYVFRIAFKLVRLLYRLIKKGILAFVVWSEPYRRELVEYIYYRACKTFDLN